jgi:hypothetical protein
MFWTVMVLLVILGVLGIASQSQDFTVDDSAPLDWAPECSLHEAGNELEGGVEAFVARG